MASLFRRVTSKGYTRSLGMLKGALRKAAMWWRRALMII
jgi:hypothetical protein